MLEPFIICVRKQNKKHCLFLNWSRLWNSANSENVSRMFTKICKSNKCIFSLNLLPFSVEGSNFGLGGTRNPHYKNGNTSVATIVISKIKIPPYVIVGQTVHLYCLFELKNGTDLYTLKWFKDGAEFYRSVPRASVRKNRRLIFPMPGVRVDFENSKVRSRP